MSKILWGFDFGHRGPEPGLSNEDIAAGISKAITRGEWFDLILSQDGNGIGTHGLGLALLHLGVEPDFCVGVSRKSPDAYLNTWEVIKRFMEVRPIGPSDEVIVACHQTAWTGTRQIARSLGIRSKRLQMEKIRYDRLSWQFLARGPLRCWIYKFWSLGGYISRGEIFSLAGEK